jgi:hypothetical protein
MMSINAILMLHQPWYDSMDQNSDSWGCECNKKTGYATKSAVITYHIGPIVRAAALQEVTSKLKRIFEDAGMDLDVILKSEKLFGGNGTCAYCGGTGTHWYNPDYPMGDCGQREPEPCLYCNGKG